MGYMNISIIYPPYAHSIDGFSICALCHFALTCIDILICQKK